MGKIKSEDKTTSEPEDLGLISVRKPELPSMPPTTDTGHTMNP